MATITTTTVTKKKGARPQVKKETVRRIKKKKKVGFRSKPKRSLGKSKAKHELGMAVTTPGKLDYDYTLIQSGADTRPFDASFVIAELNIAPNGQIVFQQSLSAVAAAIMQQESNKDAAGNSPPSQTMVSGILNYLEYRFTKVELKLLGRVPDNVSGEIGIMFVPPSLKVTSANFIDIFTARNGDKRFPGTMRVSLERLREGAKKDKPLTIQAEFQKGGRPIGLSEVTKDGVVGRVVIGMLTDALSGTNTVYVQNQAPVASSSTDTTISAQRVRGDLCRLSMHVEGHWIFTAPGQVPDSGAISALEVSVPENFDPTRVFTGSSGSDNSYSGNVVNGTLPPDVAEAILNAVSSELLRGNPMSPPNVTDESDPVGISFLLDSGGTIGNFFTSTTVKTIANLAVEGVAEFFPPGVRQLVAWGGRTMVGVIDRLVNTQDGMLAKEQNMTADNQISISNGAWPGSPNLGLALTPTQTHFTPGRNTFNGIPLSPAVQLIANHLGAAENGSVHRNIFNMLTWCLSLGIYPFFATATAPVSASIATLPFENQDNLEIFLRSVGGLASWIPTILTPAAGATDDYYAGIPLFMNGTREGSLQSGFVKNKSQLVLAPAYQTNMGPKLMTIVGKATERRGPSAKLTASDWVDIDFWGQINSPDDPTTPYRDGSLASLVDDVLTDFPGDIGKLTDICEAFFGHRVSRLDGRWVIIEHKFTYAARAARNDSSPWSPRIALPPGANDSGYCTITLKVDSQASSPSTYFEFSFFEHSACSVQEGKFRQRSIPSSPASWDVDAGAMWYINPARCYSV